MVPRLLDRQISLLDYLTGVSAIFGTDGPAALDLAPPGFDTGLLRLEACFSHEKRMEKITAAFPQTFRLLGKGQSEIARKFASACPPTGNSRIENARQFCEFIAAQEQTEPPYLPDVATCEFSLAKARVAFECGESDRRKEEHAAAGSVRRARGLILRKCEYDVRGIFEVGPENAVPVQRDTLLAILIPPGARNPQILELLPVAFETLDVLEEWTDTAGLGCAPELDAMLRELAEHGLVEVRP
jgi:hypothetical protein